MFFDIGRAVNETAFHSWRPNWQNNLPRLALAGVSLSSGEMRSLRPQVRAYDGEHVLGRRARKEEADRLPIAPADEAKLSDPPGIDDPSLIVLAASEPA